MSYQPRLTSPICPTIVQYPPDFVTISAPLYAIVTRSYMLMIVSFGHNDKEVSEHRPVTAIAMEPLHVLDTRRKKEKGWGGEGGRRGLIIVRIYMYVCTRTHAYLLTATHNLSLRSSYNYKIRHSYHIVYWYVCS